MPIDFYYIPGSAPCRAVLLAAKAVGVDLNLKLTDLMAGEHLKPEFVKVRIFLISAWSILRLCYFPQCRAAGNAAFRPG